MQAVFCSNSVHILTIELIRNFREVFYRKHGFIKGLRSCISFTKQTNIIIIILNRSTFLSKHLRVSFLRKFQKPVREFLRKCLCSERVHVFNLKACLTVCRRHLSHSDMKKHSNKLITKPEGW